MVLVLLVEIVVTTSGVGVVLVVVGAGGGKEVVVSSGRGTTMIISISVKAIWLPLLTGRRAVVGDDLGLTSTTLLVLVLVLTSRVTTSLNSATLMQGLVGMTTHMSAIRNGSAGDGGRGGQKSSLHGDKKCSR